jgi:lipopolysaccharide export LptBFGC system permease protein LptF
MSSSQQIQSLSDQFNTLLSEYQSTYNDFINTINSDDISFTTVDNSAFNGSNIINTTTATSVSDCSTSCSSNTSCSGATFTTDNNNCILGSGAGNIIKSTNSTAIVKKAMNYSYQLQNLNQQLLDINQEINSNINESYNSYQTNLEQVSQRDEALQKNYVVLTQERENIKRIVREYETLNSAQENGDINTTMNYYKYIILLFIVLLLIFLLLRFSIPSDQSGGSSVHKMFTKMFGNQK